MKTTPRFHRTAAVISIASSALLVIGLGFAKQPADPPRDLSASLGTLDEGLWSHNSVNAALFGKWRLDDFNPMFVTSVPPVLMRVSYAVFGVGIVQTRIPSILLGAMTVAGVGYLFARRDLLAGVAASSLLAGCYLFLAYSRLGLLETPAAALLLAAVALISFGFEKRSWILGFAGGVFAAASVSSKPQVGGVALGVVAAVGVWMIIERKRDHRLVAVGALGGLVAGLGAWSIFVVVNLDRAVRAEWKQHALGVGFRFSDAAANARRYASASDGFGTHARPLLIAAAAGLVVQAIALVVRRTRPSLLQLIGAGWGSAGIAMLAVIPYSPSRYAVLCLPGLAMTAAGGVSALGSLLPKRNLVVNALIVAGLVVAAAFGTGSWLAWARNPDWSVRQTALLLEAKTRPSDVILGGWALVPATQAHRRVITPFVNTGLDAVCPLERYGVDFVIWAFGDRGTKDYFDREYPGVLDRRNLEGTSEVIGHRVGLYRVPTPRPPSAGCATVRAKG